MENLELNPMRASSEIINLPYVDIFEPQGGRSVLQAVGIDESINVYDMGRLLTQGW